MATDAQPQRSKSTALLLIDVQQGVGVAAPGGRNNPGAEANMARLLQAFRATGMPVIHVRHDSTEAESALRPGLPGNDYQDACRPRGGEPEFAKAVNSAFVGTGLEAHLRERGISTLVIAGLTTEHCVSASARSASDLGFDVILVADATAACARRDPGGELHPAELVHRVNLASLDGEFCRVRDTAAVLAGFA